MSSQADTVDRIEAEVSGPLGALGLDVEAVELTPAGRRRVLRIAVDQDGGVTLDQVAEATRTVDQVLETSSALGEQPYTLEVTSRGVDRPLTAPRHWRRNVDRLVKVTTQDGSTRTGRILASEEDPDGAVTVEVSGSAVRIGYAEVTKALVQVEFKPRPASRATEPSESSEENH